MSRNHAAIQIGRCIPETLTFKELGVRGSLPHGNPGDKSDGVHVFLGGYHRPYRRDRVGEFARRLRRWRRTELCADARLTRRRISTNPPLATVCNAGRKRASYKKQFLDDIEAQQQDTNIANLRHALLIFHSPVDSIVSIQQAQKTYLTAKHPESLISLNSADHLPTNNQDADYVASCITASSSRHL